MTDGFQNFCSIEQEPFTSVQSTCNEPPRLSCGAALNGSVTLTSTSKSLSALVAATLALTLPGCGGGSDAKQQGGGAGGPQRGPVEVGYVTVQPTDAAQTTQLPGRVTAYESSEVRPQVTGIVRRRLFKEGSIVSKGQKLYEIDPRLYRASVDQAEANLQSARADAEAQNVLVERYKPLADMQAISKQDYTNAVASSKQATASVAQTKAALETARVNLQFTSVPAPISGRIGRSLFTVGALVSATQTDPLARIQKLDPIFVDIQQSSGDLLALRRALASGKGIIPVTAQVRLKLEDGSDYGQTGSVQFSEAIVDPNTGTVTLRARFPNPQGVLLPGMFVQTQFVQAINTQAFLVPQPGVSRDPKGNATVYIVGPGNKAVQKTVTADRAQGEFWVVTSGLSANDKVIVQGTDKIKPGQPLKPVPANTPQKMEVPRQMQDGEGKGGAQGKGG